MSSTIEVRTIQEHDGRFAARCDTLPNCIGYGATEPEARAEFDAVRAELTGQYPPKLRRSPTGWEAQSTMYPSEIGKGPTPKIAIDHMRGDEASEAAGDFEDYSNYDPCGD